MNELVLDESESQLAPREANGRPAPLAHLAAAPTVESMIVTALERGTDPATLERLVALAERVQDRRAEEEFNRALLAFRKTCPPIIRTSAAKNESGRVMYHFADLSEVTKVVDPHLFENGLSYTWDTDDGGEETIVICWLHHVAGAKRSARFKARGSGTKIMSPAQVEASVVTFGKRQSLVMALGIQTDIDDDGRRAAPRDRPDADPDQPKVPPRAERAAQPPPTGVTVQTLNCLMATWQGRAGKPQGTLDEFVAWAAGVVKADEPALLRNPRNWTAEAVEACERNLL